MSIHRAAPVVLWLASDRRQQTNDQVGTGRNGQRAPDDHVADSVAV
jgi:hypothetical protein